MRHQLTLPEVITRLDECGFGWTNDEMFVLVGITLLIGFFLGWLVTRRRS